MGFKAFPAVLERPSAPNTVGDEVQQFYLKVYSWVVLSRVICTLNRVISIVPIHLTLL